MRIAVTSEGPSLDARVDQRFGRCKYFLIINTDDLGFEAVENQNAALGGGAGIQSAQMIADKGVARVFTGACGPNAYQVLASAGIEVVTGCAGVVRDVIGQSRQGSFTTAAGPNVADHYGMGQGFAAGSGRGMGMGRGMGAGFGGQQPVDTQYQQESGEDDIEALKRQMQEINKRIQELENKKKGKGK